MMKKLIFTAIILILIITSGFFFYSKRPNLDVDEYNVLNKYENVYASPSDTLTISTFNIGYLSGMTNNLPMDRQYSLFQNNMNKAISVFKALESDIVAFQEIDFDSDRSWNIDQLEVLTEALTIPEAYKSINWDKKYMPFPYWPPSQQFGKVISGQATLSKYPIKHYKTVILPEPDEKSFLYDAFYLDRLVQETDLIIGDRAIKVLNVHLEAFDETCRVIQAEIVKSIFEEYANYMPVILLGDFNSSPYFEKKENKAMEVIMRSKYIKSAITNKMYLEEPKDYYTFSSIDPYTMIDYILYNENFIECLEARVVKEAGQVSDHLPVTGKFRLFAEID